MAQRLNRRELMEIAEPPKGIHPSKFDAIYGHMVADLCDKELNGQCPEKIAAMSQEQFNLECIRQMKIWALKIEAANHSTKRK
tara:strand:- start:74 stop:322 length:249 start_codon:yes stop_codon:yes gene_type:complete